MVKGWALETDTPDCLLNSAVTGYATPSQALNARLLESLSLLSSKMGMTSTMSKVVMEIESDRTFK